MTDGALIERRSLPDRRVRRVSLHYPERRTGFDRRDGSAWTRLLLGLRSRPSAIVALMGAVCLLSAADLLLTRELISQGATEVNPVMAVLLEGGLSGAVFLKAIITVAVIGGIWVLRRYRRVLGFGVLLAAGLTALVIYEAAGLALT